METSRFLLGLLSLMLTHHDVQAHAISERATIEKNLYVLADRSRCVTVQSISPCPVNGKLTPFAAKSYSIQAKSVASVLTNLEILKASDECTNAVKTTMCGQATPLCSDADGSQDYGNVDAECPKIYSSCPDSIAKSFKATKMCDKVLSGKIAKPKCVTPPKIEGNCPQPKYKMPTDALALYKRNSAANTSIEAMGQVQASTKCKSELEELQCAAVYCSEDEKYLMTEYTKEDCARVMKHCYLDPLLETLKKSPALAKYLNPLKTLMEDLCEIYPTGAGNIHLAHSVVLMCAFIVAKLFA